MWLFKASVTNEETNMSDKQKIGKKSQLLGDRLLISYGAEIGEQPTTNPVSDRVEPGTKEL